MANNPIKAPSNQQAPTSSPRTLSLSYPIAGILFALTFVCGLLAGSLLTLNQPAPQPAARVQQAPTAQAPQGQPQARPQVDRQTADHIAGLEKEVLANPKNRDAWVSLGNLYFDTHQVENSIRAYEHALTLDRNDANVLTDLGVMYRAAGNYQKALDCFAEALKIEPGHMVAMFNTGVVLNYDLHKHEEAIRAWEKLVSQHPDALAPDGTRVKDLIETVRKSL